MAVYSKLYKYYILLYTYFIQDHQKKNVTLYQIVLKQNQQNIVCRNLSTKVKVECVIHTVIPILLTHTLMFEIFNSDDRMEGMESMIYLFI